MAAEKVEQQVDAPPAEVWALAGDFGGIGEFFPGLGSVRLEGDDRVIAMGGMEIRERLVDRDDAARTLTYSIVEGVPVEHHVATVAVVASGAGSTATWEVEVVPDEMLPVLVDSYRKALEALADRFRPQG